MKNKIAWSDIALLLFSTLVTLMIALLLIRWLQPSLLGIADDLILVQSSREKPPFYELVFDKESLEINLAKGPDPVIPDPVVKGRGKPLMPDHGILGPNDLLGFRNLTVPNTADIIVIGDSQTYGNNALITNNWPSSLQVMLPAGTSVYSMATGGWGALQYFYAFAKSLAFMPKVIIVAFYTGNDPLESFNMAYGSDHWATFRVDPNLDKSDVPGASFPAPPEEQWAVTFSDGISTVFTPELRHVSNKKHPAVDAGYAIMTQVAQVIADKAGTSRIIPVFTIIPTKEYVYASRVEREGIAPDPEYQALVTDEHNRIQDFSAALAAINNAVYVDIVADLQNAALENVQLYPSGTNGHPVRYGYRVIAQSIHAAIAGYFENINPGYYLSLSSNQLQTLVYLDGNDFWVVDVLPGQEQELNKLSLPSIRSENLYRYNFSGHLDIRNLEILQQVRNSGQW